jgi:4-hydroxy-3-polyprenylbenzoate decarboxylase
MRKYKDLREHIAALEVHKLLRTVDVPVNKDTQMHPLVRWQYRGGLPEEDWRAFLFTRPTDARGRSYDNSVLIGGLAANPAVYAVGLGCSVDEIGEVWGRAFAHPVDPVVVEDGPVHEVVQTGEALQAEGGGFDAIPIPISTPGFDNAPYLTSAHVITKDPETGIRNVGHYRGQVKGRTSCGLFWTGAYKHGHRHWKKAQEMGLSHLEVAFVVGAPPVVSYAAVQQVPYGTDEYGLAGGLCEGPIELVKCKTVDLEVPAHAEIVLEGRMRTDWLELEGPFGESHGFVHPRSKSPVVELTAVTHRKNYIWTSFISQVTPSESSVIKRVSFEPMLKAFLVDTLGIAGVRNVVMHEPLTNLRKVVFVQFDDTTETEVWRALKGVSAFNAEVGKVVIAVDSDIDPHNLDAVMWAIAYRSRPHHDVQIIRGQFKGHGPPFSDDPAMNEDSNLLINATLRGTLPPLSLPKREYMEDARTLWESLGLPHLRAMAPWFGQVYSPEEWPDELEQEARLAVQGRHYETGDKLREAGERIDRDQR